MSLIACCPACQTSYRVVPDQLRISDGWVRCGQCGEIFDASQQLIEAETAQTGTDSRVPADDLVQAHPSIPDAPALGHPPLLFPESPAVNQQRSSVPMAVSPSRQEALSTQSASELSWASAALLIRPSAESESDAGEPTAPSPAPLAAPVSFMLAPDVPLGARQNSRPVLWWGLGAMLMLGLLLQGLYRERDQLAALFPALKPALQSVCAVLDCRVSPLQGIENLAIDSATFHQVGLETFELRFVVKNNAHHALALPAIELTLTDLADQPVMRRIFTPAELAVTAGTVASAGEWSATAYLRIRAEATGARAQGYRLLIFYP